MSEGKSIITKNKKPLIMKAIEMLKKSKKFNKFGVPVKFLKPSKITITTQHTCVVIFELK